ncbi:MAG: RNA polymerase sigma factor [Lachnospiraceae bacterium]|nr:RNA polymerase sigma factor [Lachnospiraceae bacterium]
MINDAEVIKSVLSGNVDDFEKIVIEYEKVVYNTALKLVKNEADAYDISQDTFIKVYKNLDKFGFKSSFKTWICVVCTRVALDLLKSRNKYVDFSTDEDLDATFNNIPDTSESAYERVERNETQRVVRDAINKLDKDKQDVIKLRYYSNMSYSEISDYLNIDEGTVKSRLNRAKKELKRLLSNNI